MVRVIWANTSWLWIWATTCTGKGSVVVQGSPAVRSAAAYALEVDQVHVVTAPRWLSMPVIRYGLTPPVKSRNAQPPAVPMPLHSSPPTPMPSKSASRTEVMLATRGVPRTVTGGANPLPDWFSHTVTLPSAT